MNRVGFRERWKQSTPLLVYCVAVFSMGDVLFGLDTGQFGGIQALPSFLNDFGENIDGKQALSNKRKSLMNSLVWIGRLIGTTTFEPIVERIGYKKLLYFLSALQIIGVSIELATRNWIALTIGRMVCYASVGLVENSIPSYCSEISPPLLRGFFSGMFIIWNTLGAVWGAGMSQAYSTETRRVGWMVPVAVQYIPAVILLAGVPFCIESPRWLVSKGRDQLALKELRRVRPKEDEQSGMLELEVDALARSIELDRVTNKGRWIDTLRFPYARRVWSLVVLFLGCQGGGLQFWVSYGPTFLKQIGFGPVLFTYSTLTQVIGGVGAIFAALTTDILGRRGLCVPAGFFNTLWMGVIAGCSSKTVRSGNDNRTIIAAFMFLFFCQKVGFQTHGYLMSSELGGTRMRKKLMMIGTTTDVIVAFTVSFTTPYLMGNPGANLGPKVGFIFTGVSFFAFVNVFLFLPEVAGRGLEEIDELFQKRRWGWQYKSVVTTGIGAQIASFEMGQGVTEGAKPTEEGRVEEDPDKKTADLSHDEGRV